MKLPVLQNVTTRQIFEVFQLAQWCNVGSVDDVASLSRQKSPKHILHEKFSTCIQNYYLVRTVFVSEPHINLPIFWPNVYCAHSFEMTHLYFHVGKCCIFLAILGLPPFGVVSPLIWNKRIGITHWALHKLRPITVLEQRCCIYQLRIYPCKFFLSSRSNYNLINGTLVKTQRNAAKK